VKYININNFNNIKMKKFIKKIKYILNPVSKKQKYSWGSYNFEKSHKQLRFIKILIWSSISAQGIYELFIKIISYINNIIFI